MNAVTARDVKTEGNGRGKPDLRTVRELLTGRMVSLSDVTILDKRRARTTGLYVLEMKPLEKTDKGPIGPEGIMGTVKNGPEGGVYPVKEIRGNAVLSDPLEGVSTDESGSELRQIKGKLLVRLKDDITDKAREELANQGITTRRYLESEDGITRIYAVSERLYENSKSHKTAVYAEITPTQARSLLNMDLPVMEPQEKVKEIRPYHSEDNLRRAGEISSGLWMWGC